MPIKKNSIGCPVCGPCVCYTPVTVTMDPLIPAYCPDAQPGWTPYRYSATANSTDGSPNFVVQNQPGPSVTLSVLAGKRYRFNGQVTRDLLSNVNGSVIASENGNTSRRAGEPTVELDIPCQDATIPIHAGLLRRSPPFCLCEDDWRPPQSGLAATITYLPDDDPGNYGYSFQDCTLDYYCTAPGYMGPGAFSGAGWYSTTSWVNTSGDTCYHKLSCFATQYSFGAGAFDPDFNFGVGEIYRWSMGGSPAVNICLPFTLSAGRSEGSFRGKVVISG